MNNENKRRLELWNVAVEKETLQPLESQLALDACKSSSFLHIEEHSTALRLTEKLLQQAKLEPADFVRELGANLSIHDFHSPKIRSLKSDAEFFLASLGQNSPEILVYDHEKIRLMRFFIPSCRRWQTSGGVEETAGILREGPLERHVNAMERRAFAP